MSRDAWIEEPDAAPAPDERPRHYERAGHGVAWETTTREPTKSEAEELELRASEKPLARELIRSGKTPEAVGRIIIAGRRA